MSRAMKRKLGRRKVSKQERVYAALELMQLGYRDYIGARTLLREELCVQGAVLASTAVEKYLKSILAMRGNTSPGHLKGAHVNSLRNYVPELFQALNPDFLSFLTRCYQLRYTDRLPPGFHLKVFAREVLAELDYTIHRIEMQVNFRREPSGERIPTSYRKAVADRCERLHSENYVLAGQDKEAFLSAQISKAYGMLNRGGEEGILEVEFTAMCPTDGKFNRFGIRRIVSPEDVQEGGPE